MTKKYRLTYTLYTELGKRTRVETFRYFETVLQVVRNLIEHCDIDNVLIEMINKPQSNSHDNVISIKPRGDGKSYRLMQEFGSN